VIVDGIKMLDPEFFNIKCDFNVSISGVDDVEEIRKKCNGMKNMIAKGI
jgi:hypothetical protein